MKENKPATLNAGRLPHDNFRFILIHWLWVGELFGRHCPEEPLRYTVRPFLCLQYLHVRIETKACGFILIS